jgi:hypothetical protein
MNLFFLREEAALASSSRGYSFVKLLIYHKLNENNTDQAKNEGSCRTKIGEHGFHQSPFE